MSKIEKIQAFYEWLYERVQNVHTINDEVFYRISEKL